METKEYLSLLSNIDKEIIHANEESKRWREIAQGTTVKLEFDKVQESVSIDPMGDAMALAVDYEEKNRLLAMVLIDLRKQITDQLRLLEKQTHYNVLWGVFVQGKTFTELAHEIGYCTKQVTRYYRGGMDAFEKMFGDEYLKIKKRDYINLKLSNYV